MTTKYLCTLCVAATVAIICAIWAICNCIQTARTKAPDLPPDYFQLDVFAAFGIALTAICAIMGV